MIADLNSRLFGGYDPIRIVFLPALHFYGRVTLAAPGSCSAAGSLIPNESLTAGGRRFAFCVARRRHGGAAGKCF
jgi:hypothetical protein